MSSPSDLADEALVRRVAEGEHEAFAVLYARHSPGVFRFARLMTGSTAFSEDVVQDVFLDLMRQAAQYDPARGRLTTYLFALARYRVRRQWLRHRRWSPLDVLGDEGRSVADPVADPHAAAASRQWTAQVRRSVLSLPSRYREVVVLCDLQGLSYAEAASGARRGGGHGAVAAAPGAASAAGQARGHPAPSGRGSAGCRRYREDDSMSDWPQGAPDVRAALETLRDAERDARPSAATAARVMAAWDAAHAAPRRPSQPFPARPLRWVLPLAASVCAVLLGVLAINRGPREVARPGTAASSGGALDSEVESMGGPVQVVRLAVPVEALADWGVRPADTTTRTVALDVYVGEDGVARAVRVPDETGWRGGR